MIIGEAREQVIENIRKAVGTGRFHVKVEEGDPVLTRKQKEALLENYLEKRESFCFWLNSWRARHMAGIVTRSINRSTKIAGLENMGGITGGAIVTSNHFSPLDNTVVRDLVWKLGKKRLCIVSQETNLAMTGWIGYLMNYADTIPISSVPSYMAGKFELLLSEALAGNEYVLIYPEQEMWFNYRKPRPAKRGAYYYAAKFKAPVISCFVEMNALDELDTSEFYKVEYVMHVLPTIYPDPAKSVRENSIIMCEKDYEQKKAAYESAYGKPLDYKFESSDIAGWIPVQTIPDKLSIDFERLV
ncbi:lysophospholipid acyltransferase family protein [Muricomes intestini]|uniref:lysophospholipid acyltransferase family protein n=1 Tax=Muricomes intestini TaxID=1796634 RepID=UPI002FE07E74